MFFKVEKIIDYNRIQVSPDWNYKGISGNTIRITGIEKQKSDSDTMKRLESLLQNKFIELRRYFLCNPSDPLTCRVFVNTLDISRYFETK